MKRLGTRVLLALTALALANTGCLPELEELFDDLEIELDGDIDVIGDVTTIDPGSGAIIVDETVVVDVTEGALADITVLVIENLTGRDLFISYTADFVDQGVAVLAGETVVIEYLCLADLELIARDDYDPFDGFFIEGFDFLDFFLVNPGDFFCGEGVIWSFDLIEPAPIEEAADPSVAE